MYPRLGIGELTHVGCWLNSAKLSSERLVGCGCGCVCVCRKCLGRFRKDGVVKGTRWGELPFCKAGQSRGSEVSGVSPFTLGGTRTVEFQVINSFTQ